MSACVHCGVGLLEGGSVESGWSHITHLGRCQAQDVPYGHMAHPADVECFGGVNPCEGFLEAKHGTPCTHIAETNEADDPIEYCDRDEPHAGHVWLADPGGAAPYRWCDGVPR